MAPLGGAKVTLLNVQVGTQVIRISFYFGLSPGKKAIYEAII